MFLDYFALAITIIGASLVIYTFIYIHDIPYQIAKKRNHDQKEAIHLACWLSLFTLHAIWPIVFIWAVSHKKPTAEATAIVPASADGALLERISAIETRLRSLESAKK